MQLNKSKINLTNKICSTLFFVFTIISFIFSILVMVKLDGNPENLVSKYILNYGLTPVAIISIGLNIYLITGMMLEDKQNYKNVMFYILIILLIFSIVAYIYSIVNINNKYTSDKLISEFWLLLIASGASLLFGGWHCLITWNLLKPLSFNREELEYTEDQNESDIAVEENVNPEQEETSTNA